MLILLICIWYLLTRWENFFFISVNGCFQLQNAAVPGKRMLGVLNCKKWLSVARKMSFYIFLLISNKVYSVRDERAFLCLLMALIQTDDRCAGFFLLVPHHDNNNSWYNFPKDFYPVVQDFFSNFCFSNWLVAFCIW